MLRLAPLLLLLLLMISCQKKEAGNWIPLLDRELSQWENYLSYSFPKEYDGSKPMDVLGKPLPPLGLNQDRFHVFRIIEEENTPVLKISGEIYGCVFTKKEYGNYHLRLQVKWGNKKYDPRKDLLMDSGILYHSVGEPGSDYWRSWMPSQEFQIMEGHMGDYWSLGNTAIDVRAYLPEYIMNPVADESQAFLPMGTGEKIPGFCLRSASYEYVPGEWNTLELICYEDKSLHLVNGKVVMILQNSRIFEEGKIRPLKKGKIQLQSEGAEVFFKNIEIRSLDEFQDKYSTYFMEI